MSSKNLSVVLLHEDMVDKQNKLVTTSLTMIDVHDIARSSKTYGVHQTFVAHPSPALRKLAKTVKTHWEEGFGSTYNPNRKEALEIIDLVSSLDEAIHKLDLKFGKLPKLVATSAKGGGKRIGFSDLKTMLDEGDEHYLMMLGTGWGMSDVLLDKVDLFLEPVNGPTEYNHLSVRSACAILLDRLLGS